MIPSNDDFPSAQECLYTSHYCEENVFKICEKLKNMNYSALGECFVVFVTNDAGVIPLWYQKAGTGEDFSVTWDYHVFLVRQSRTAADVFDLDSLLGFPCSFVDYVRKGIGSEENMDPAYHRLFRVLPARFYLKRFASDRSHMKNEKGEWLRPPPAYDPIQQPTISNNLEKFISTKIRKGFGVVLDLTTFTKFFNQGQLIDFKRT